ncbi:thermostable hemolysin [Celerinatantimonas diazotrophica]|uniref:Thermostable hemolysin n=1 Tax=Celerinatantimonas diazotrophica TaxID=412034 RepID=A0A4R1K472_9GAMM|nr:thermostable hemolysin [Celerinatantimonas diazotrophica]TCK57789.1 thermostable hemolysin [Celerinatantimonas diazotrophica]CAG9298147.1 hypothetical protein CEDIAZO_03342 [Celerinatantimonas diazotrophica]
MHRLQWVDVSHPQCNTVRKYVYRRYKRAFNAQLDEFMPVFLTLFEGEKIVSVCGIRAANTSPLFLEQYLDQSAETLVSNALGTEVKRSELIEFGQLASFSMGFSREHFHLMAQKLINQGFRYCIFTATQPLMALMKRMGLSLNIVHNADDSRVTNVSRWGSYYQHRPQIVVGCLQEGLQILSPQPAQSLLGVLYE